MHKGSLLLLLVPVFLVSVSGYGKGSGSSVVRLSEPVSETITDETFGRPIDPDLPRRSLAELASEPKKHLGTTFLLETEVAQVCQKKGCFFIARDDEYTVRVAFRDYGFFIPTDSRGKSVTLVGELVERQVSAAEAEHFSADLSAGAASDISREKGSGANLASGRVFEIVADAVQIPKR